MDKNVWAVIRAAIRSADATVPRAGRRPRFSDRMVVKMYFWSVAHDRPRSFACERSNLSSVFRPRSLPSYSQFCRRLHSERVVAMIAHVCRRLAESESPVELMFFDGKALPIGESSKDPDARTGRGHGKFSRGYKLHALAGSDGRIKAFSVCPMNEAEPRISREQLTQHIPPGVLVLADGNYDSKHLYTAVRERQSWLFAPVKRVPRTDAALRNTTPERREAIEIWEQHPRLAKKVYGLRGAIERIFSHLSCFGGGLAPLPAWVRRIDRVRLWVTAKIAIYHARLALRRAC